MLKCLIFCFLGSALCFGQIRNNSSISKETAVEIEVPVKGNGGGVDNDVKDPVVSNQALQPAPNIISISSSSSLIYKYSIYDMLDNLKTQQSITPCSSYSVDISFLPSDNYKIIIFTQNNQNVTKYFSK